MTYEYERQPSGSYIIWRVTLTLFPGLAGHTYSIVGYAGDVHEVLRFYPTATERRWPPPLSDHADDERRYQEGR